METQKCTNHNWVDTGGQLMCWPPIKVYQCSLCLLIGNVRGRQLQPMGPAIFNEAEMTYEGKQ